MTQIAQGGSVHRCLSSAEVVPGGMKRCIRDAGHKEKHLWVEARNVAEGAPILVEWDERKQTRTYELHPTKGTPE